MKKNGNIKTIEKAVQHFEWKLSNKWNPTKTDIEAYNFIMGYVKEKQQESIIDNDKFAKLYVYLLGQFMTYYDCGYESPIPQKELNKLITKDLSSIISDLMDKQEVYYKELYIKENNSLNGFKIDSFDEVLNNLEIMVNGAIRL